jgi:hypothetical protein
LFITLIVRLLFRLLLLAWGRSRRGLLLERARAHSRKRQHHLRQQQNKGKAKCG